MATDFRTLIESLKDYGFFDIVLPFLLVFTLIFAILEKTKLLGLEGQNAKTNVNQVINSYISNVGLLIVIALLGLVLFGLLGVNVEQGFRGIPLLIAVILAIIGLIWSLKDQTYLGINFGNLGSSGYLDGPLIVTIVVIIIVLFVLLRQGKSFDTDKFSEGVDKQFGKGGQKR